MNTDCVQYFGNVIPSGFLVPVFCDLRSFNVKMISLFGCKTQVWIGPCLQCPRKLGETSVWIFHFTIVHYLETKEGILQRGELNASQRDPWNSNSDFRPPKIEELFGIFNPWLVFLSAMNLIFDIYIFKTGWCLWPPTRASVLELGYSYCSNLYNLICVLAPTLSDIVGFAVAPKADQSRFQPLDFGFWGFWDFGLYFVGF